MERPTMPRYRSIACVQCGYMQLKRDTDCDRCGQMTERAKKKLVVKLVYMAVVAVVAVIGYFKIQGIALGLGT